MSSEEASNTSKLQAVNYANIVAFVANVAVTYGVGVSGYFPTNAEISQKYQSLVTPAAYAFAIWGVIFVTQFIWTILQALPKFRSSDLVVKGVNFYYVWVCVAQCAWSICFAQEWIEASVAMMLAILVGLVLAVGSLRKVEQDSIWKFFAFKFPFFVHCGWIWAASVVNINVLLVYLELEAKKQEIGAWVSLAVLFLVAANYLYRANYVVPLVFAWASYAVNVELKEPKDSIMNTFEGNVINQFQISSLTLSLAVLVSTVLLGGLKAFKNRKSQSGDEQARLNEDNTDYSSMQN